MLVRTAIRTIAREAIYNRTWVGTNVGDSEMGVIDKIFSDAEDAKLPNIVIYTDDMVTEAHGSDVLGDDAKLSLVFELSIQAFKVSDDPENTWKRRDVESDAGMEMVLDIIERQIRLALIGGGGVWSELFSSFVPCIHSIKSIRASENKERRFAARQITYELTPAREPTEHGSPRGHWQDLIDALEASDGTRNQQLAVMIREVLGEADPVTGWEEIAQRYGLSHAAAFALGIAPATDTDDETTFSEISAEAEPTDPA